METGGYIGKIMSEKIQTNGEGWFSFPVTRKSIHYGIYGGMKIKILRNLSFTTRYYLGLSDFDGATFTDNDGQIIGKISEKTRNIQLGLAYQLVN